MDYSIRIKTDPSVNDKFQSYPPLIKEKMLHLRQLVLEVAGNNPEIRELEECLKWGEPAYVTPIGSTLRMDWKEKSPKKYALYFKCTSKLVPAFKQQFPKLFTYEKTRAILFDLDEKLPEKELKQCIAMALTYHKIKKALITESKDANACG